LKSSDISALSRTIQNQVTFYGMLPKLFEGRRNHHCCPSDHRNPKRWIDPWVPISKGVIMEKSDWGKVDRNWRYPQRRMVKSAVKIEIKGAFSLSST